MHNIFYNLNLFRFNVTSAISELPSHPFEINAENIERMDVSNRSTMVKISNFIINKKIDLKNELHKIGLLNVELKLEQKIKEIKSDTTGIIGFFRYLFNPRVKAEKQLQIDHMTVLQKFIRNVRVGKNTQENETAPSKEFEKQAEQEQAVFKAPTAIMPSPIKDQEPPLAPIQPSIIKDQDKKEERPLHNAPTSALPIETTGSPSSEGTGLVASPLPELMTSKEEQSISVPPPAPLPPPPPPPGAAPIVKKKFNKEPQEPNIILPGKPRAPKLDSLSEGELRSQIKKIETFVNEMKAVLEPIQNIVKEEAELKEQIKEKTEEQNQLESEIKALEAKKAALEEPVDISYFKLKVKGGELDFPLYSDKKFQEYNDELKKLGAKPLSTTHLKREVIRFVVRDLEKAETSKEAMEKTITSLNQKREAILAEKNNSIPFTEYAETLKTKQSLLGAWERALAARGQQLKKLLKTPESHASASKRIPLNKTKIATTLLLSQVIIQNEYLAERKDLLALTEIENNQDALIKLKGDQYYRDLFIELDAKKANKL